MPKERSILLIEDNLAIARQVVDFLEGLGWNVDFASSGQLGIKLALNAQFNVILLDLNLPDTDGLAVCQAIKEQAQRNQPILMVTARDAFEDKAKGYITKEAEIAKKNNDAGSLEGHLKRSISCFTLGHESQQIIYRTTKHICDTKTQSATRISKQENKYRKRKHPSYIKSRVSSCVKWELYPTPFIF